MFALWLMLVIAIGASPGKRVLQYRRLSHNGVTLHGIARGRAPHQQIEYSYEINGQTYQGVGRTGIGSPSLYEISIGDKVSVYFLPDAPEISCLGDPAELYSNDLPPTLLVSLLFPTAIVIALAVRISRKRRLS